MALSATIYKCHISLSDLGRHHYQDYSHTIALHPSETPERMMVRVLAFCLYANDQLEFTRGLSTDDEPDLWQKNLSGDIENWIELGQPDEKRIRKACSQSDQVVLINYQQRAADIWWQQIHHKLARFNNLQVVTLEEGAASQMAALCSRNMQLQVTVEDGIVWINNGEYNIELKISDRAG